MAQRYYLKELVSRPVLDRNGKQIPFEEYGGDYGGITLNTELSPELIEDLDKMCADHVGGVVRSSEDEQRVKKSLPKHQPPPDGRSEIRVFNPPKPNPHPPGGAAAAVNTPIPPLSPMPRTDAPPPSATQEPPPAPVKFNPRVGRPGGKKAAIPPASAAAA